MENQDFLSIEDHSELNNSIENFGLKDAVVGEVYGLVVVRRGLYDIDFKFKKII